MLYTIDSDTPFDVVFINFWESGEITDQDGSCNIITCLYCTTLFGLEPTIGMKEFTPNQEVTWYFGNLFVPFGLPKMIVMDAGRVFAGISRKISYIPYKY